MPTKTKKNPNVVLSNKVRNILCKAYNKVLASVKSDMSEDEQWKAEPEAINSFIKTVKKAGILSSGVDTIVGIQAASDAMEFANSHPGHIVVYLLSDKSFNEEIEMSLQGEGQMEQMVICAVPLALAKKIAKKGSL